MIFYHRNPFIAAAIKSFGTEQLKNRFVTNSSLPRVPPASLTHFSLSLSPSLTVSESAGRPICLSSDLICIYQSSSSRRFELVAATPFVKRYACRPAVSRTYFSLLLVLVLVFFSSRGFRTVSRGLHRYGRKKKKILFVLSMKFPSSHSAIGSN